MKTIIFDFNRTLYDPHTGELMPGAVALLTACKDREYVMHLVSRFEPGRAAVIEELGIAEFFSEVAFVKHKNAALEALIRKAPGEVIVVGDRLHDEIREGNRLGAKTVLVRNGMFADLKRETELDVPWREVEKLTEVGPHLFQD